MDYRLQAIIDSAKSAKEYADSRARTQREATAGATDVNKSHEIAIARMGGESTAYQWIIDQLSTFDVPPAGGAPTGDITSNRDHSGSIAGCRICAGNLSSAMNAFASMCSEAENYGWNDSDTRQYRDRVKVKLDELQGGLRNH